MEVFQWMQRIQQLALVGLKEKINQIRFIHQFVGIEWIVSHRMTLEKRISGGIKSFQTKKIEKLENGKKESK